MLKEFFVIVLYLGLMVYYAQQGGKTLGGFYNEVVNDKRINIQKEETDMKTNNQVDVKIEKKMVADDDRTRKDIAKNLQSLYCLFKI